MKTAPRPGSLVIPSSNGQDTGLSRRKREFESHRGYQFAGMAESQTRMIQDHVGFGPVQVQVLFPAPI